jgi:hypothetical protein
MDSDGVDKTLESQPATSVPFSHPDPNHIHHCPEASHLHVWYLLLLLQTCTDIN